MLFKSMRIISIFSWFIFSIQFEDKRPKLYYIITAVNISRQPIPQVYTFVKRAISYFVPIFDSVLKTNLFSFALTLQPPVVHYLTLNKNT